MVRDRYSWQEKACTSFKKFSGGGGWLGGVESDYSVCPHLFLQFFSFCLSGYARLCQVMSGYVRLCQFISEGQDVELDNIAYPLWYSTAWQNVLNKIHHTDYNHQSWSLTVARIITLPLSLIWKSKTYRSEMNRIIFLQNLRSN